MIFERLVCTRNSFQLPRTDPILIQIPQTQKNIWNKTTIRSRICKSVSQQLVAIWAPPLALWSKIAHLYLAGHNVWGRGGTWCAAASAATSPVRQNGRHPFFGNPLIPPGPPLTTTEFRILKPSAVGLPALLIWCVKDAKAGECEVEPRKGVSSQTISLSSSEVWSLMYWSHGKKLAGVLILKSPFQICDIQTLEYSINQSLAEC